MSRRVLITRPAAQAGALATLLRERGLHPVVVPTVSIDTTATATELDTALADLDGADWLILTSANGADAVIGWIGATGRALPATAKIAAVGPATAETLRSAGIAVDHVPPVYLTEAIADGLGDVHGRRVLLARADAATSALADALRARGARVTETAAYRTVEGPLTSRGALHAALHDDLAAIAFTSGSTVRGLLRLASPANQARARSLPAFCIGPVTAAAARQGGFDIAAIASEHTAVGLADAIATYFARGDA